MLRLNVVATEPWPIKLKYRRYRISREKHVMTIQRKRVEPTICRLCLALCPVNVEIEDGRAVRTFGDKNNPAYFGYTCIKGRNFHEVHYRADRLLHCRKRMPDGSYQDIPSAQAITEIAARLRAIIDAGGPRAVAAYGATGALQAATATPMYTAFMDAIGSPMRFNPNTIDQPGKQIADALHGGWNAEWVTIEDADCWLMVGMNPPISKIAFSNNPSRVLNDAMKRGLKLVVIDPRRTETTRFAAIHLQPKPGQDPAVLAGMVHVILAEGLENREFVARNAQGLEELRAAVAPFTPDHVAQRAGIDADQLRAAARLFASGRTGGAGAGTGTNMATHGNLSEYLLRCLMTLCGYWSQAGTRITNPAVMVPAKPNRAEPTAPYAGWGFGEKMRVRGFTNTASGLPVAALPDEILLAGEGQVKALICIAGNPMVAWPDQEKTARALKALDLLVVLDLRNSATAQVADYVIAAKYGLEVPGLTAPLEFFGKHYAVGAGITKSWAQYTPPIIAPPEGSDLLEDWEFFYLLAREMGLTLELAAGKQVGSVKLDEEPAAVRLDMANKPTSEEIVAIIYRNGRIPFDTVKAFKGGHLFDEDEVVVAPRSPDCTAWLQLDAPEMMAELTAVSTEHDSRADYPFRLVGRRMIHVYNSAHREMPELARGRTYNPLFMHPDDMAAHGLARFDKVRVESPHSAIWSIVEPDDTMRRGVTAMTHAFGVDPDRQDDVYQVGSNIGRLTSNEVEFDSITGIPRMSGIPVRVSAATEPV
jgi:anaerobic selenocysteine-containing dehydrogenase